MFCSNCGKELPENVKFCPDCGYKIGESQGQPQPQAPQVVFIKEKKTKSKTVALLLCFFLGMIGFHDFYLDNPIKGISKILILVFLGWLVYLGVAIVVIWVIIDFFCIALSKDKIFGYEPSQRTENIKEEDEEDEEECGITVKNGIIAILIFLAVMVAITLMNVS